MTDDEAAKLEKKLRREVADVNVLAAWFVLAHATKAASMRASRYSRSVFGLIESSRATSRAPYPLRRGRTIY